MIQLRAWPDNCLRPIINAVESKFKKILVCALIKRLASSLIARGFKNTFALTYHLVYDFLHDMRLGIRTGKKVRGSELGYRGTTCVGYSPTRYRNIFKIINSINTPTDRDILLDYGCGKGRVLIVASKHPFQRVIGVELNPKLCAIARQNIQRAHKKLVCKDIQVVNTDAALYSPPADVTHFFFYNPFGSDILSNVLENMRVSLDNNPRDILIITMFPNGNHQSLLDDCRWLQKLEEYPVYPLFHSHMVRIYSNR